MADKKKKKKRPLRVPVNGASFYLMGTPAELEAMLGAPPVLGSFGPTISLVFPSKDNPGRYEAGAVCECSGCRPGYAKEAARRVTRWPVTTRVGGYNAYVGFGKVLVGCQRIPLAQAREIIAASDGVLRASAKARPAAAKRMNARLALLGETIVVRTDGSVNIRGHAGTRADVLMGKRLLANTKLHGR